MTLFAEVLIGGGARKAWQVPATTENTAARGNGDRILSFAVYDQHDELREMSGKPS